MENDFFVCWFLTFEQLKNEWINKRMNDIFVYLFHHKLSPYQPKVCVCLRSTLTVTCMCSVLQFS